MSIHKIKSDDDKKKLRKMDPYLDRRSGDDRRRVYSLAYFNNGGVERRKDLERRTNIERRKGCFRTTTWSSVCVTPEYPVA